MIGFLIIVIGIFGVYMFRQIYTKMNKEKPFTDVANTYQSGKDITITLYYVDWCPHCKTAKPEWKMFMDEYNNTTVNGYKIVCNELNCTDDTDVKIQQSLKAKNIDSFPTIRAVMPDSNGKEMTIRFDSKTSKKNLEKFVLSISSK
jgi:thiol-disulfide isomerase/thioredoxin